MEHFYTFFFLIFVLLLCNKEVVQLFSWISECDLQLKGNKRLAIKNKMRQSYINQRFYFLK